ncbi:MAG: hypothetical protein QM765_51115 [Myxococcales bacterium]
MTSWLVLAAATHGEPPPAWLIALFPVFFVAMWCLVGTVLGFISGHSELLARFPPVDEHCEESFGSASGRMRGVNYNGALYVGIGSRGLHLAASWLFRPVLQRGIPCIPWQQLRLIRSSPAGFLGLFKGTKFEVAACGLQFSLNGEAGKAVERKLASFGGQVAAPTRPLVR